MSNDSALLGPTPERVRFVRGDGRYAADIAMPGMLEMAVLRSRLPHANLRRVDLSRARELRDVHGLVSGEGLTDVTPVPDLFPSARPVNWSPLVRDRIRYVGAPIAAVVAQDRYVAEDALELIECDYDELPPVLSAEGALVANAPRLYDNWPDNRIVHLRCIDDDVAGAFARATRVVSGRFRSQRQTAAPLETRGCVAAFADGRLTLYTSTQFPYVVRAILSVTLGLREADIRVIAPDVGGGFGCKAQCCGEDILASWFALKLRRPVRFIEDRDEHFVAAAHARDMSIELEAAVDDCGLISAIRGTVVCDVGSGETYPCGFGAAFVAAGSLTGPYKISAQAIDVTCAVTNKTPSGAYRGFGLPEANFAIERLIDRVADVTGQSRDGLRRRMILRRGDLPFVTPSGCRIDSGSHYQALDRAMHVGRKRLAVRRQEQRAPSLRIGLGVSVQVQGSVPSFRGASGRWGAQDSCSIRFDPGGCVVVAVGVSSAGQDLRGMVSRVVAGALQLPESDIRVVMGDTDLATYGLGGWGSRSTVVVAGAVVRAARRIRKKACRIAAYALRCPVADIQVHEGRFTSRRGGPTCLSWHDIAELAYVRTPELPPDIGPGLEASSQYDPPHVEHRPRDGRINACATYTNSAHAAIVGVDVSTGQIEVLDYVVVHDSGRLIDPVSVRGLIAGGVAQGIGATLSEVISTSAKEHTRSLRSYLVPTISVIPAITIEHIESPARDLPLGVKGAGEAGIAGPSAAIVSAIEDALHEFHVAGLDSLPIHPRDILCALSTLARIDESRAPSELTRVQESA